MAIYTYKHDTLIPSMVNVALKPLGLTTITNDQTAIPLRHFAMTAQIDAAVTAGTLTIDFMLNAVAQAPAILTFTSSVGKKQSNPLNGATIAVAANTPFGIRINTDASLAGPVKCYVQLHELLTAKEDSVWATFYN